MKRRTQEIGSKCPSQTKIPKYAPPPSNLDDVISRGNVQAVGLEKIPNPPP